VVLLILLALTSGIAILLGLMVVGLFEAPWPVLLSLLFVGLWGLQRLAAHATEWDSSVETTEAQSTATKAPAPPPESQTDDGPIFTYRGVKYHAPTPTQPSQEQSTTITEGIYRGQHWRRGDRDA